jgi:glycopeptide antibiotics resistance protein
MIADLASRCGEPGRQRREHTDLEVSMLSGGVAYLAAVPAVVAVLALHLGTWRTLVALIAVAHLVVLASVALFPLPVDAGLIAGGRAWAARTAGESLNLVPFATIGPSLAGDVGPEARLLAVLNLLVLAPAGAYLPILVPRLRTLAAFLPVGLIVGGSIEAAQAGTSFLVGFRYRHLDVDDWILNTIGLFLGFAAWWAWDRARHRLDRVT